jgi:mitochondrial fission protein ELM1
MTSEAPPPKIPAQPPSEPRIWVLMGQRAGDNAQLLALAEQLGWPYEVKRLAYRRTELVTNLLFDATLLGRVRAASARLEPPWPDLVLSSGRRSEPVARWIRARAHRPPKLVHVGRPWRAPGRFDLVIVTPQYRIAPGPGVLRNPLPLHGVTAERLAGAAAAWEPRLAGLPRPRIAVLVGGNSELFTLDAPKATRLAREAGALVRGSGGSLLVTTSARTPPRAASALRDALDVPAHVFHWSPGAPDNPYWGYLALADAFVVTGDSVSMLTEACATGKPVFVFDPGRTSGGVLRDPRAALRRAVMNFVIRHLGRDLRRIHDELVRSGHAAFLGQPFGARQPSPPDPLERAVGAVRALFAASPRPGPAAEPGCACDAGAEPVPAPPSDQG